MSQKSNIKIKKLLFEEYKNLIFNDEISYLQSWDYGEIKSNLENINAYRYLIYDTNNIKIGYFQLLSVEYFNLIFYAKINRGPVLLQNIYTECEILSSIKNYFLKKLVLVLDVAPDIKFTNYNSFYSLGFFRKRVSPWSSSIINLSNNSDYLFKKLDPKWRNAMLKSVKNNIEFIHCNFDQEIISIQRMYEHLKMKNNFVGLSTKMLNFISNKNNFKEISFDVFSANLENSETKLGYIIILNNSNTSTYLLGVTNDLGRKYNVNSFLLWNAILESKKNGNKYFDTGGMGADTPLGIFKFKNGLNGERYSLIGEFRYILFFSYFYSFFNKIFRNE